MADSAGLHRTYISAVECGKRNISIDNIEKVALTLKVDAYLLFIDKDKQDFPQAGSVSDDHVLVKGAISDEPGDEKAKTGGNGSKL